MTRSAPLGETELESIFDWVRFAGLARASQNHDRISGRCTEGPAGNEFMVSDNGATNRITSDARNVYDWVEIPPEKRKYMIGDGEAMRVIGSGSLNLRMHWKMDFDVKLTGVYVTEGIGFNLCSIHQAQARHTIIMDKEGAHLFDRQPTFPRDEIGSCLYATRLDRTPTARFTAVPAFTGAQPPPRRVLHPPPSLDAPLFV